MRPHGIMDFMRGRISESSASKVGVSITPGWIEFTRIPRRPRSCAADFVIPRDAHFVAWYAKTPGKPVIAANEEMLMIEPPPAADIDATTAFIPRNTPS